MLFNSYIFILLFLPLTIVGYFGIAKRSGTIAQVFLISMSLWFYGYFNYWYLLIICSSIVFNYLCSKLLNKAKNRKILIVGILVNVGVIFYYKYLAFCQETINQVFGTDIVVTRVLLPLGISFFTFQQISFLVDSYKGETRDYGFVEYALFVSFFPQLIAGPIVLHREMIPQFRDLSKRQINADSFYKGMVLFSFGLFKKVIIADTFSKSVTWAFNGNISSLTALEVFVVMLSYTFQIYFDFSAYSDMATGIARMFNFELPVNFNSPYKAVSIPDFWKRWHMTLTRFLREYIYFPLGGSKKGNVRTYLNIMIVFLVSGIWHGANWTFILWGLLHGIANSVTRILGERYERMHIAFRWFITFFYVNILWLLFRADSIQQWMKMILRMFKMESLTIRRELIECFWLPEKPAIFHLTGLSLLESKNGALAAILCIFIGFCICLNHKNNIEKDYKASIGTTVLASLAMVISVLSLSGVSEFIYFNF